MAIRDMESLGLQGLTGRFVGAGEKYLVELERECSFSLPTDYKDFLKRYGASLFVQEVGFRPLVASPWAVDEVESFDVFYGVSDKPEFDLLRSNIRLRNVIPGRAIAIGYDPGSNLILLNADGTVCFFDRETGRLSLCATDFRSFLDSFQAMDSSAG
jgi:hypothetical protein